MARTRARTAHRSGRWTAARHLGWLLLVGSVAACGGKDGAGLGTGTIAGLSTATANSDADPDPFVVSPGLTGAHFDAATLGLGELPGSADTTGGAWRIIDVPGLDDSAIVHTPRGWFALSRGMSGGKAITGVQSALYRSSDGIHWASIPLVQNNDLAMRWLVYGAGRYVMSGQRYGAASAEVLRTSSDGEHWTEQAAPAAGVGYWDGLAYVENRFFDFGLDYLAISDSAESWKMVPISIIQGGAAAYGNGVYLLTGNGPMQTSTDGWSWQEHPLDCSLSNGCITDPSGGVHQNYQAPAVFAEGRFYSGQLSSVDGAHWQAEPGPTVDGYVSGHFLSGPSVLGGLATWVTGGAVQTLRIIDPSREAASNPGRPLAGIHALQLGSLPDHVSVEFDDGLTCETAPCVLLDGLLLLVPPPGTPPLVDRVPRVAGGAPLLSRDCPVSNMIVCDDYARRTGCVCQPEAPRGPESCEDVSQYRCAGQFRAGADEWQLDEVGPGGCDCDAIDPAQPPSFGTTCSADASLCQAPLVCLPIDPATQGGAPPLIRSICTSACRVDADCPSWQATGMCAGPVHLKCSNGSCQPRSCDGAG
jgi:hypothetical protein